jgi:hypothetical protein
LGLSGAPKDFDADVLFLVDSSNGISSSEFANQKEFVKYTANLLNVKPGKSRAAVVSYGDKPTIVAGLDGYSSIEDLHKAIDDAQPAGGSRRIDTAFDTASQIFTRARPQVPKVVVLVNGGKQGPEARRLDEYVKRLHNLGIKTFVVAAGPNTDYNQLRPAVENNRHMITVPLFTKLHQRAPGLANLIAASRFKDTFYIFSWGSGTKLSN